MKMTESQRTSMIRFTEKLEKAYRDHGKDKDADAAKRHREQLTHTSRYQKGR
jgi:hypothetical protein